jgi:hypothetical protein
VKAILSCTNNPLYDFFIPIAVHSWNKIGVECIVFIPEITGERFLTAQHYCSDSTTFHRLNIEADREPTYFQVVRLLACCLDLPEEETLITSDIDMAVFGEYLKTYIHNCIMIFGSDLTPESQYPMCYISTSVKNWRKIMDAENITYTTKLHNLLRHIEGPNIRGNHWSKDQELLKNGIDASGIEVIKMTRAYKDTQFATRRSDRDGWHPYQHDLIDSHLPRPGYTHDNFRKILELFQFQYPSDNFDWMIDYKNKYSQLHELV